MFRHILLYLIISCLSLCRCYIHIIKFNRYIYIIIRLLFQLGQKNYRLHMRRSREEVDGGRFFDFISKLLERGAVACERGRVAGDVYYPVGNHFCGGSYRLLRAALARRVEDYHLGALALGEQLFRGFARVRADKPRVLYSVCGGVFLRVLNSGRHRLYAD